MASNEDKKLGIGVIGAGMAFTPHARSLVDLSDILTVHGVFSRSVEKRSDAQEKYGFPPAQSIEEMLENEAIDAFVVLTPPNARLDLVRKIAAAGKHIFMEKPIERSSAAALEIVETCEKANVQLGITFQHRFRKASMALRDLVASGALGDLVAANLVVPWWRPQSYYDEPGRGTLAQDGGGVLITQAVHSMDLFLSFTGKVAAVSALGGTTAHEMETEDFVGAGLQFANGAMGGLVATTSYFPGFEESMTLAFTKGTAILSGGTLNLHWHDGRNEEIGEPPAGTGGGEDRMAFPHDWHRTQIEEFVHAVQADRAPISSGRTALEVHKLIDALMESAQSGQRVELS